MTWEIVVGIISLVGVFVTVGGVVFKLSKVLASLEVTIKDLDSTVQELKTSNQASHKEYYERLNGHDLKLENHEGRIRILEEHER